MLFVSLLLPLLGNCQSSNVISGSKTTAPAQVAYLGFDRNDYPGDSNLRILRQTFSFSGYWLNNPPGAKTNSWVGKRKTLQDAGFGFLVLFMYLYGFYKDLGGEALTAFEEGSLNEKSGRSFQGMLLGDLGRADVHAFLLHRLCKRDSDYRYAWGRTYLGSIALLVPASIWPDRPPKA